MGQENKKLHLDGEVLFSKGEPIGSLKDGVLQYRGTKKLKGPILSMLKRTGVDSEGIAVEIDEVKPEPKAQEVPIVTSTSDSASTITVTADMKTSSVKTEKPEGIAQMGHKDPDVIDWVKENDPELYKRKNYAYLDYDALRRLKDATLRGNYPSKIANGK